MSSDATGVGALLVAVPSVEELPADAGRLLLDESSSMGRARFFLEAKKDVIMVEEWIGCVSLVFPVSFF